jgi:hypothetical protein
MDTESNFDEEVALTQMLATLEEAVSIPTVENKLLLEKILSEIDIFLNASNEHGDYSDIYTDLEYEICEILNGSEFRSDEVCDGATKDSEILSLVYKYISPHNENVEVVLAANPYISETLKWELANSEFEWEEDGTRETLSRNSSDPELLSYLSEVGNDNVKHQVALNHATPLEILDRLIHETGQCNFQMEECLFGELSSFRGFIRWAVAQNPNTQVSTLEKVRNGDLGSINKEADLEIIRLVSERLSNK